MTNKHQVSVSLTPAQFAALNELAKSEQSELPELIARGVDTLLATYNAPNPHLEARIDKMHNQLVKLLVTLMKLVAQAIYFASLPVTTGPVKAKLNDEGIALQWHRSEKFAVDLLQPPASHRSETAARK